ncbi:DUF1622 domain-containing protein [Deefgea salmonis]|uniref:DUF1622 domain-containing protein n=1 Tax=Deefgea salmonis TaxID=2875502 RepID=A0ABS8BMY3_9NEIS|nr:DUF1622 domain-containing protein [Deefgea salmonis]MCB5197097.1 DUF1622 domain-containing protein [Deefgea salmonis]
MELTLHTLATGVEYLGIAILLLSTLLGLGFFLRDVYRRNTMDVAYNALREQLGKGILLSLEFLIISDIIYTIAIELTVNNLLKLGLVVLIRTFLSFTMELELSGRWPWQKNNKM